MSKQDLILFGAGGLGRVMLFQIQDNPKDNEKYNILGFVDDTPELQGKSIHNYPILGNSTWLQEYHKEVSVIVCVAKPKLRQSIVEKIKKNHNINFPNFIAEGVKISSTVTLGQGCIISFYNILPADIQIGDFFFSSHFCTIGHDVKIHDFVTLYANVNVGGGATIGSLCELSTGAILMPRTALGAESIIGLGSALYHSIPEGKTAIGVPARIKFSQED